MNFTQEQLKQIFTILQEECGALPSDRESFVFHIYRGCQEYRCCYKLGFGGKFYPDPEPHVSYYKEDETPEREKIREKTNKRLQKLVESFQEE